MFDAPDWEAVEQIVGLPDYAVVFCLWPWPDGGWMAGVALHDREWAVEQGMPERVLRLTENMSPEWNCFDGFTEGINQHGGSAAEAVDKLSESLTT